MADMITLKKMVCKYPLCKNYYPSAKKFHTFPKDCQTIRLWKAICGISQEIPNEKLESYSVCEDHFVKQDFKFPNHLHHRVLPKPADLEDPISKANFELLTEIQQILRSSDRVPVIRCPSPTQIQVPDGYIITKYDLNLRKEPVEITLDELSTGNMDGKIVLVPSSSKEIIEVDDDSVQNDNDKSVQNVDNEIIDLDKQIDENDVQMDIDDDFPLETDQFKTIVLAKYCRYPNCNNNSKTYSGIFHQFPKDAITLKLWRIACKITNEDCENFYLCGQHFLSSDYVNIFTHKLKKKVIPQPAIGDEVYVTDLGDSSDHDYFPSSS